MNNLKGKKFIFAIISIICVSVVSILLHYGGEVYIKLVGLIVSLFIMGQTFTDYKKGGEK